MTVANEVSRSGPYTGNGVATVFDYEFRIIDAAHIRVIRAEGGIETTLALGADYTVAGVGGEGGGSITTAVAPTASQVITILRNAPFTQETDLENQGPYFAETIEASLDLAVMRDQQLSERMSRALLVPASSSGTYDADQLINDVINVKNDRILADTSRLAAEAAAAALGNQVRQYDTRAQAAAATIPAGALTIRITRDATGSPVSNETYIRGTAAGPMAFADATGAYWQLDMTGPSFRTFSSRAALATASVPPVQLAHCLGYDVVGDCSKIVFRRVASQPLFGGVRSADRYLPNGTIDNANGGWWVYVPGPDGIDACAFGVKADWDNTRTQLASAGGDTNATDCRLPLQNALNFASMQTFPGFDSGGGAGQVVLLPKGTMMFTSVIFIPDGVVLRGTGVYSTILKLSSGFPNSSHAFIVGTPGDGSSICASQTRASAGAMNLNGNSVVNGVAQLLTKRVISVYSTGNNAGITFTITGTDGDGNPQTETKAGPNNGVVDYAYYNTVTSVTVSGPITGNVNVGNTAVASFGSRAEEFQVWSNHTQAQAGKAIFYSNNTQHTGGLSKMKIYAGNRSAVWFETGIGGASCFTMDDVECQNYGNSAGVASNNPCMYFNYAGLLSTMRRIVVEGSPGIGGASIGIQVDGGLMHISDTHVENYGTGIFTNVRNINNGLVTISNYIGSGGVMVSAIRMDAASTTTPHLLMQGIMPNGALSTVNDGRPGGASVTGNILAWLQK